MISTNERESVTRCVPLNLNAVHFDDDTARAVVTDYPRVTRLARQVMSRAPTALVPTAARVLGLGSQRERSVGIPTLNANR